MSATSLFDFSTPLQLANAAPLSAALLPDMRADRPWGELVAEAFSMELNARQQELLMLGELELVRIVEGRGAVYAVVLSSDAAGFGSVDAIACASKAEALALPVVHRARMLVADGDEAHEAHRPDELHRMIELRSSFRFPVDAAQWQRALVEDLTSGATLRQRRALRRVREELMFGFSALREVRAN